MGRRFGTEIHGNRYIGNTQTREVHDLDSEDKSSSGCQIDLIIASRYVKVFDPDILKQAHLEGYLNCDKCIGKSVREFISEH